MCYVCVVVFFKQKTAYEMRISDWSSDVCSSDLLGHQALVVDAPWPVADLSLLVEDEVTIAVQINGKRRDELVIARDADNKAIEAAALALDKVEKAIDGKAVRKVIVVPGKIINIVV